MTLAIALLHMALEPASAEWVEWIAEADAGYAYDSNVANAGFDSEELDDSIWFPAARVGRVYQFEGTTRLRATAEARGDIHRQWTRLDSVSGSGELSLSHKFGVGDVPWGRIFFSGGYEGVRDAKRSGSRFDTGAQLGMRLSPRFDSALTYRFTARDGGDGVLAVAGVDTDVWDQQYHEIGVDGRVSLTRRLFATAGYEFRYGDLSSNSRAKRMQVIGMADVKAVARDWVFGGWTYRLRGEAHSPFVGLSYGLDDHWSIDASYRFRYAESDSLDYENHIGGLTALFRY